MSGGRWIIFLVALAAAAVPLWGAGSRWRDARDELASAHRSRQQVRRDADELARLEHARERVGLAARPSQDVHGQVEGALAELALDQRMIRQTTQESDVPLPAAGDDPDGPQYYRQSLRLNMQGIRLAELGLFLAKWREDHPVWTPTRIELTRSARRRGADDGRFNALIHISTIYIGEGT